MLFELYENVMNFLRNFFGQDIEYSVLKAIGQGEDESWLIPSMVLWVILFWFTYLGRFIFKFIALFAIFGISFIFFFQ